MAQLEASRREHDAAGHRARQELARERWASERTEWLRMFAHPTAPAEEYEDELQLEPWIQPEWEERDDKCNDDVRYDIVWTIS